ncbi:MAG TPA: M20 family metallopeptidase [Thermoanaerobacterales bacterium]|nr:M20 family metallopeptidase [Thermoanaerobacterales bacterium]
MSKDKPFMKAFAESYEKVTGTKHEFALEYGGSYAKAMPNVVCWGPLFPDEEDTTHEVNEKMNIENLVTMTNIFAEAIKRIVLNEESFK